MIRTFIGKNSFELKAALEALVAETKKTAGDLGVERIDASETDVDAILQAVQAFPFLVSKKLIIISSIQSNNALLERLNEVIDRTADGVEVVFVEPAIDKRKAAYKLLQKQTALSEFKEHSDRDIAQWVVRYTHEQGGEITLGDALYLVERIGAHQDQLAREIEKLVLYRPAVTRGTIEDLTDKSITTTIFNLIDAAFRGDRKKAIQLYREQRAARLEPQYIVAMLAWQLQNIATAVFAVPRNEQTLIAAGMAPFTAQKSLGLASKIDKTTARLLIQQLTELDASVKYDTDADAAIELYLLGVGSPALKNR